MCDSHQCQSALVLFAKAPELGRVKTRLAKFIGNDSALSLYKSLLQHCLATISQCSIDLHCFVAGNIEPMQSFAKNCPIHIRKQPIEGDLGARIVAGLEQIFVHYQSAIVIGADCPTLTPRLIGQARQSLAINDTCIAATKDGGYALIGLNAAIDYQRLFQGIAWSTDKVYRQTLDKIADNHCSVSCLPLQQDIDLPSDLICWQRILNASSQSQVS